jgi:DNA-binding GntR family transcriptional regulator
MRLPRRQVLSDDVYDAIKAQLLANRLPPRGKINIDELARELSVSNTPIRQALSRLEVSGDGPTAELAMRRHLTLALERITSSAQSGEQR